MAFTELNRFAPEVLNGQLALVNGNQPNALNVMFSPTAGSEYDTLKAGDAVIFQEGKSLTPLVRHSGEDDDIGIVGVVLVSQKKDAYKAGDMVEVACRGTIIYMKADDDIERGEEFGNIGISLDTAEAGEFARVSIAGVL